MRIAIVIGTRPEAIKLAPVARALRTIAMLDVRIVATAQHREMLDQMFAELGLAADIDLDLMRPDQTLSSFAGRALSALGEVFASERPDYVIGQGDTTTVLSAALAAYHASIPFGHVEAGLRSGTSDTPFPEEKHRTLVAQLARHHFCPTPAARINLLREGIAEAAIHVTGNPSIDSLLALAPLAGRTLHEGRSLLVTVHRRENFEALPRIADAVRTLLDSYPDLRLRWPVHRNPRVAEPVRAALADIPQVDLLPPLGYGDFVREMAHATLILSDSGGVQEEAPALGTPVLVLRDETERPEGIAEGVARLVGSDPAGIVAAARALLDDPVAYARMTRGASPYGDGRAAGRIARIVAAHLLGRDLPDAGPPLRSPATAL